MLSNPQQVQNTCEQSCVVHFEKEVNRQACCWTGIRLLSVLEAAVLSAQSGSTAGEVSLPSISRVKHPLLCLHVPVAFASMHSAYCSGLWWKLCTMHDCIQWFIAWSSLVTQFGAICRFDPATSDFNELKRLLTFSTKFVNSLHLQQLPSHLDLQIIFEAMRRCVSGKMHSPCSVPVCWESTLFIPVHALLHQVLVCIDCTCTNGWSVASNS